MGLRDVHPFLFFSCFVLNRVTMRVLFQPGLSLIEKVFIFALGTTIVLIALFFEAYRLGLEEEVRKFE